MWLYSQPIIHQTIQRNGSLAKVYTDKIEGEKRDVHVVTHSLIHKSFHETHILKQRHDMRREKRYVVVI